MKILFVTLALVCVAGSADAVGIGQPAPDFTLKSFAGNNLRLEEMRGKVVFINFWASWCGPCRQEMPILNQIGKRYAPLGLVMWGVNVDTDLVKARQTARETGVTFPLLSDKTQKVSHDYSVAGMPFTVIVDRDGVVRYVHRGYSPGDERQYIDRIRQLLSGGPAPE